MYEYDEEAYSTPNLNNNDSLDVYASQYSCFRTPRGWVSPV
jgi:hypothetical protein